MGANEVLLERITVGAAGAGAVTFQNIPQSGYTDLKVVMSVRTSQANIPDWGSVRFNGDTAAHYSYRYLNGSGTAPGSSNATGADHAEITTGWNGATSTTGTFASAELYIPNYLGSQQKSFSADAAGENNSTAAYMSINAMLWNQTSTINSITLASANGATIQQYSTFSLYGIATVGTNPVIAPYATGGDIIQTDGTYWYHAFLSSSIFTPKKAMACDVLVVAGGGGGGAAAGSGAGAGGVLAFTAQGLTSNTSYAATVGAGGAAGTAGGAGTNGGDSQFSSLTLVKGGGTGVGNSSNGITGGSGSGAGGYPSGSPTAGSGTTGQGYAGGTGYSNNTSITNSGGGGGAGGVGGNAAAGVGGVGGIGITSTLIDAMGAATSLGQYVSSHYYFAGGGGGGTSSGTYGAGGNGGGGTGAATTVGTNGTPNTGGGGGGGGFQSGGQNYFGGTGGSGVIIVRYAI